MTKVGILGPPTENKDQGKTIDAMVQTILKDIPESSIIVTGDCYSGTMASVRRQCKALKRPYLQACAWWGYGRTYNKSAGLQRNMTVVNIVDQVYFLWDGKSEEFRLTMQSTNKPMKVLMYV
jgi:hypothetical protein